MLFPCFLVRTPRRSHYNWHYCSAVGLRRIMAMVNISKSQNINSYTSSYLRESGLIAFYESQGNVAYVNTIHRHSCTYWKSFEEQSANLEGWLNAYLNQVRFIIIKKLNRTQSISYRKREFPIENITNAGARSKHKRYLRKLIMNDFI